MSDNYLHSHITAIVIKAFYNVYNNYLKATEIEVGLLLSFGKKAAFKRKVFSSEYKNLKLSSLS
jgi:hypothetical protein